MAGTPRRAALVVASHEYLDQSLSRLRAPEGDAEALARTLADPAIGAFEVRTCVNEPSHVVRREIARFYADRGRDDLLLLYFSGHGIKDQAGRLFFAMRDTERELPDATAIPASFVNDRMHECRARTNLLVLDCCFAGAFARGLAPKGDVSVHVGEPFASEEPGAGRVVLTASDAMQYAFEGDEIQGRGTRSIFTGCLVEGLRTGAADLDHDGEISVTEIYDYLYDQIRSVHPQQRPLKWEWGVRGRVVLARNPSADAVALPPELTAAVTSTLPSVRLAAVDDLTGFLHHPDRRMVAAARGALEGLSQDDSRQVAAKATTALGGSAHETVTPTPPPEPPPSVKERSARRRKVPMLVGAGVVSAVAVVAVVGALLAASSKEDPPPPTTRPTPTTVATTPAPIVTVRTTLASTTTRASTTPTTASPFRSTTALAVGDCFNPPTEAVWSTVRVINCSEPHVYEVISNTRRFTEAAGAPWPGDAALSGAAEQSCKEDFPAYVGIGYRESRLYVYSIYPSKEYWDSGGRQSICLVKESDSRPIVGTVKNLRA